VAPLFVCRDGVRGRLCLPPLWVFAAATRPPIPAPRSFNHPSVIMHGFFNEGPSNEASCVPAYATMADVVRERTQGQKLATWASDKKETDVCFDHADVIRCVDGRVGGWVVGCVDRRVWVGGWTEAQRRVVGRLQPVGGLVLTPLARPAMCDCAVLSFNDYPGWYSQKMDLNAPAATWTSHAEWVQARLRPPTAAERVNGLRLLAPPRCFALAKRVGVVCCPYPETRVRACGRSVFRARGLCEQKNYPTKPFTISETGGGGIYSWTNSTAVYWSQVRENGKPSRMLSVMRGVVA
jgi:hypothetical protein